MQAPDYPLRLLTLVESIVEDPDTILRRQLDKLKDRKMAEMKMEGIGFDERIEELEKLEYPKPDREFIYSTFNEFADRHPWVGQDNIRPKSIVREMFETYASFSDYIRTYDLHRVEGLLLRHLNAVYGVLDQTVPDGAKTDEVREMELYLGTMIRQVDSSILDEWEKMRNPAYQSAETKELRPPGAEEQALDVTRDTKKFTALIRTRLFAFLSALQKRDFEAACGALSPDGNFPAGAMEIATSPDEAFWTPARLQTALEHYQTDHSAIRLDVEARNIRHTWVKPAPDKRRWQVRQMVIDPDDHNDWMVEVDIDMDASRQKGEPVMRLVKFEGVG
jgi:hypothetical protein